MRLSIGVPAYNHGAFLREALESLLRQDEPFAEIVVSDNHSTDETAEVIAAAQAAHPGRIRAVRPPAPLSAAGNWNFTMRQLGGDWVSLLSSDDVALPGFARTVRQAAESAPGAALVRGGWREIDREGRAVGERYLLSVSRVTRPAEALFEQRFGPKASFAAFALRRDVYEQVGGFPEDVTILADWAMWLLAGALGESVYTGDLMAAYRVGHQGDFARRRLPVHVRETLTIYRDIMPRATELAGLGRPAWIAEASRTRFREMVQRTSTEFAPEAKEERAELVAAFRPWSDTLGEASLLARLERGDVMRSRDWKRWLRERTRRLKLGRLLRLLRGR